MSYYALTGLINAATSTFLGLIVYFSNRKSALNKSFALFCLSVAAWSWVYIFWPGAPDRSTTLFWFRALHIGAIFIPICYFHFTIVFLNLYQQKKRILKLGYLIAFIFFIFDFTPLFIRDMVPKFSFRYWAEPGILYHFFLLMFFGYTIYCWYLLFKAYRESTGIKKEQIKYILAGTLIGFVGGSTNYPLWYNIPIPPFGNGLVALYVILTAYAITKHYLFGIRVILTELLVGAIALILFIQALTAPTFWLKVLGFLLLILFSIVGYLLIKSVLTEIKRREESERLSSELATANIKLRAAYKKLEELDRAKSEFISIASHQLRTPLSAIKGYISMLLEKTYGEIPGKVKRPLENVYLSCGRLIKLVNDLLSVSRIEAGKMEMNFEKLDLGEIIKDAVEEVQIRAKEKNLYLKYEASEGKLPKILLDGNKIRQVILNVVDNGIRYTEKGGVTIKIQNPKSKIQIIISDTGEGMTKRELLKLFESFSRGSAGQRIWTEGIGLGLYVSKKFVELHNGKIWAESEGKGKGSTFYIELPVK